MPIDIGATGFVGIAFEVTPGTYAAPTKYFPIRSENLVGTPEKMARRPIRGIADTIGVVFGNESMQGDIEIEALTDVIPYFLYATRNTIVKSGAGPYVYTTTPTHGASIPAAATRTLSVTIVRNVSGTPVVFGYSGCVVTKQEWSMDNIMLIVKFSLMGTLESNPTLPVPTFTNTTVPFGAGMYDVEIPTGAAVTDADSFSLTIDDSGNSGFRMISTKRTPSFIWLGERNIEMSLTRDFQNRVEYDAYKAITAQSVTIKATNGASSIVQIKLPVAIKDSYEVSLSGQGELLRANIKYSGNYDYTTSKAYEIIITSLENIT